MVFPASTTRLVLCSILNPLIVALREYLPGSTALKTYSPEPFVTVVREIFVASDVSVTAKISRTTVTNGSGEYVFNAVEPGKYSLSATMRGFQIEQSTSLVVDAGHTIPLDFKLQIGSNTQTAELSATEVILNNRTSHTAHNTA